MGLNDIVPDDAGEAKGGRPPKKDIGQTREVYGDPFIPEKDNEEWWQEKVDEIVLGDDLFGEETPNSMEEMGMEELEKRLAELSDHIAVNPLDVRTKLDEHGIYETDWSEYMESHAEYYLDSRIPGRGKDEEDMKPGGGLLNIEEDPGMGPAAEESDDNEGGLFNLVDE